MARYTISHNDSLFVEYPSPSVVLDQLSKGDALQYWAANQAVDYIKSQIVEKEGCCHKLYLKNDYNTLSEARTAFKDRKESTADLGSELHKLVETYVRLRIANVEDKGYKDFYSCLAVMGQNLKDMFMQFYVWQKNNVKRFIEAEQAVCDPTVAIAGTLDLVYEGYDSKVYCVDLKTSNSIYKGHELQVVSYKYIRQDMHGTYKIRSKFGKYYDKTINVNPLRIDECAILNICRDYYHLEFKIVKDVLVKWESFKLLLAYYYKVAKRRLKFNYRAEQRS